MSVSLDLTRSLTLVYPPLAEEADDQVGEPKPHPDRGLGASHDVKVIPTEAQLQDLASSTTAHDLSKSLHALQQCKLAPKDLARQLLEDSAISEHYKDPTELKQLLETMLEFQARIEALGMQDVHELLDHFRPRDSLLEDWVYVPKEATKLESPPSFVWRVCSGSFRVVKWVFEARSLIGILATLWALFRDPRTAILLNTISWVL